MSVHLDRLRELYKQGEQHLKREEWDEATKVYLEIVGLDAGFRDSVDKLRKAQIKKRLRDLFRQAEIAYKCSNWQQAINLCQDVIAQDQSYPEVKKLLALAKKQQKLQRLFQEGTALLDQGKWKEAISKFLKIQRLDSSYPDFAERLQESKRQLKLQALYDQGRVFASRRDWKKAVNAFEELWAEAPDYKDVKEKLAEANSHWEAYRRLITLYTTALSYEKEENWEKAHKAYVEILSVDPDYEDVTWRVRYVARRKREETGTSPRRFLIREQWSLTWKRWWARWRPYFNTNSVLGVIIVTIVAGLILALLTPLLEKTGKNLFDHPVPTLVSPSHGAPLVKGESIVLEWSWDGEQNVVFEIRIRPKGNEEWERLARVPENDRRYIIPPGVLKDPVEYEWQVVAIDKDKGKEYPSAIRLCKCE